jgi:hypothetical protein
MQRQHTLHRRGVTPVQLIVFLAVILILAGLLLPIVARLRMSASRAQSQNNLKQLVLGTINMADTYRGKLPAVAGPFDPAKPDKVGTLHYYVLPYLEQQPLFNQGGGFDGSPWQNDVAGTLVRLFVDPQDTSAPANFVFQDWLATTSYPCNWMVFKDGTNRYPASIPDGTSNTLMFATRYQMCNGTPTAWGYADLYYWTPMFAYYSTEKFQPAPGQADCDPARAQAIGNPSIAVAFCDGSTRLIRPQIRTLTWQLLCDPNDGGVINDEAF